MSRPDIFGIGLAGILDSAFQGAKGSFPITLTTRREGTRNPALPTSGKGVVTASHGCRGFMDTRTRTIEGGVERTGNVFIIFGASLPEGVEPLPGDQITSAAEGKTFTIKPGDDAVTRDPAGATYTCEVGP